MSTSRYIHCLHNFIKRPGTVVKVDENDVFSIQKSIVYTVMSSTRGTYSYYVILCNPTGPLKMYSLQN